MMMKKDKLIQFNIYIVIILLLFMMPIHFAIVQAASNEFLSQMKEKIIVIDPGHGGYDKGAQGTDGTFEKMVTMEFARMLAEELKKTYKVVLTRTDDYWIDILDRTALANHLKADMFISIHTGGSFLHQASGLLVYYYEKISASVFMPEAEPMKTSGNSNLNEIWSDIQNRHQKDSKILAERILYSLKERKEEHNEYTAGIQGAPLMVLEGADMPAILIEIGYITNPKEEKSLNDIVSMSFLAQKIKKGIDIFFEK
jgi:N-acetylmuramoyl-L-alanine amidase